MKLKVSNLQNNQYVIELGSNLYFQSYDTLIAKIDKKENITLSSYWNYSRTTSKWLYEFLRKYTRYYNIDRKQEVLKLIKDGKIKIVEELEYEC